MAEGITTTTAINVPDASLPAIAAPPELLAEVKERLVRQSSDAAQKVGDPSLSEETEEGEETSPISTPPEEEEPVLEQSSSSSTSSGGIGSTAVAISNLLLPKLRVAVGPTAAGAQVRETESTVEVSNVNEAGLSWGQNKAKDDSWEERWLQQEVKKRVEGGEDHQVIYGRSSGVNVALSQRWATAWETVEEEQQHPGPPALARRVKKYVRRYNTGFEKVVEEWEEEICEAEEKEGEKTVKYSKVVKKGKDTQTGRVWEETTKERQQNDKIDKEVSFKESNHGVERKIHSSTSSDGIETKHQIMKTSDNGVEIIVKKSETREADGTVVGTESGNSVEGKVWDARWRETPEEGREFEELVRESPLHSRRCKESTRPDGSIRRETWEKEKSDNEERDFTETWCQGPDGHKWGEKIQVVNQIQSGKTESSREMHEKWYDNTEEKCTDQWEVKKRFENDQLIELVKEGQKVTNRYADNSEWGYTWGRVYQPGTGPEDGSSAVEADDANDLEGSNDLLKLRIRHLDQWWREPSGNSWGDRSYVDFKAGVEKTAKWYNNGVEKQVDEWEVTEDGTKRGRKEGCALDGSREWKETWSGDPTTHQFHVDKYWNEVRNDERIKWGEEVGHEGARQWKSNWGESSRCGEDTGKRWVEKWNDDGLGNVETFKEGEDWTNGQTTNWFLDKYGHCLGSDEKWAYKQGVDSAGNVWLEKWNELPHMKKAEKTGHNREGDVWTEKWTQTCESEGPAVKWAEKTGKNAHGEEWMETWLEEGRMKTAYKKGKNAEEEWEEKWGEKEYDDGSGEKWTSKWAKKTSGEAKGESWGDRWGLGGKSGHHWGEKWFNDHVEKWWKDTEGRPAGC